MVLIMLYETYSIKHYFFHIMSQLRIAPTTQVVKYLQDSDLLPELQSVYRANHSMGTVVLKVLADILLALDSGNLAMLTHLDLSAHDTLFRRLQTSCLNGVVINWFASYLSIRLQHVRVAESSSSPSVMLYGLPQGSVIEPIVVLFYTTHLLQLIKLHQRHPLAFVNDTQIWDSDYGCCFEVKSVPYAAKVTDMIKGRLESKMKSKLRAESVRVIALFVGRKREELEFIDIC